jgi:hypothetical protein
MAVSMAERKACKRAGGMVGMTAASMVLWRVDTKAVHLGAYWEEWMVVHSVEHLAALRGAWMAEWKGKN